MIWDLILVKIDLIWFDLVWFAHWFDLIWPIKIVIWFDLNRKNCDLGAALIQPSAISNTNSD